MALAQDGVEQSVPLQLSVAFVTRLAYVIFTTGSMISPQKIVPSFTQPACIHAMKRNSL